MADSTDRRLAGLIHTIAFENRHWKFAIESIRSYVTPIRIVCMLSVPRLVMTTRISDNIFPRLDQFHIEIPSWGFANTGTRFGKFIQPAAATTIEEKFSDAGQVHSLAQACPSIALHVLWDFPKGAQSVGEILRFSEKSGVRIGSINPNLFQDQQYKYGSFGNFASRMASRRLSKRTRLLSICRIHFPRHGSVWTALAAAKKRGLSIEKDATRKAAGNLARSR